MSSPIDSWTSSLLIYHWVSSKVSTPSFLLVSLLSWLIWVWSLGWRCWPQVQASVSLFFSWVFSTSLNIHLVSSIFCSHILSSQPLHNQTTTNKLISRSYTRSFSSHLHHQLSWKKKKKDIDNLNRQPRLKLMLVLSKISIIVTLRWLDISMLVNLLGRKILLLVS